MVWLSLTPKRPFRHSLRSWVGSTFDVIGTKKPDGMKVEKMTV
jgi:hypothetical protein